MLACCTRDGVVGGDSGVEEEEFRESHSAAATAAEQQLGTTPRSRAASFCGRKSPSFTRWRFEIQ